MPRAIWNGIVVAEAATCATSEGCVCFPANAVAPEYLQPSNYSTVCPVKGRARYLDLMAADGQRERAAR